MIQARRIGHATFETPDLDRAIDYYTQVNGLVLAEREDNRAFLASKIGQLVVQLDGAQTRSAPGCRSKWAEFATSPTMSRQLCDQGIANELSNDSMPGIGKVLKFKDPKGTTIELFSEWSYLGSQHQVIGVGPVQARPRRLHRRRRRKDERVLSKGPRIPGFRLGGGLLSFLRCGPDHHTVNFLTGKKTQMHHIAFEVKDFAQI